MTIIDNCWQFWKQKDNNSNKDNDKDNPGTCDIWDTDYNSDNWEPEFMTIFVIWQLIVTLDNIRNSCDVLQISTETPNMAKCQKRPKMERGKNKTLFRKEYLF